MSNEIKSTKNLSRIVGVLSEKALELKTGTIKGENGDIPCQIIQGQLAVETDNGTFPIRVYSASKKKDGSENKMFNGIKTIMESYVSKVDAVKSEKEADVIDCNTKVNINDYVGNDGQVKTSVQISLNSARRVTGEVESVTDIDMVGYIGSIKPEMDKNDEETGRLIVNLMTINYLEKAEPFTLIVPEDIADDFNDIYEVGQTVELYCSLEMRHVGAKQGTQAAFGRKAKVAQGYGVMELVVFGGEEPFEDDDDAEEKKCISSKTAKELMNERKLYLENLPNEKKEKDKEKKTTKSNKKGLGSRKPTVEEDEDDDDVSSIF